MATRTLSPEELESAVMEVLSCNDSALPVTTVVMDLKNGPLHIKASPPEIHFVFGGLSAQGFVVIENAGTDMAGAKLTPAGKSTIETRLSKTN